MAGNKPVLQVALDLYNIPRVLKIAKESLKGGADWLEAGTPLIKSEGMEAVRQLKRECKGATVVADLKTMDVGGMEADLAARPLQDSSPAISTAVKDIYGRLADGDGRSA